jgi:hypothetical protein
MPDVDTTDRPTRKATPSLEYKREPVVVGRVSVRGFRLLVALTLLNTTLLGASVLGPQLFPYASAQWQRWKAARAQEAARQAAATIERQSAAHTFAPNKVVYEEDPQRAAKLAADDSLGYRAILRVGPSTPPGWSRPRQAVSPPYYNGTDGAVLFLHERTTPGGLRYVVSVHLVSQFQFSRVQQIDPPGGGLVFRQKKRRHVLAEARIVSGQELAAVGRESLQQRQVELVLPDTQERAVARFSVEPSLDQTPAIDYGNILRFFGGEPDTADPSHFTIAYQVDGRDGVMDGWLKDDAIEMRPREGQWSFGVSNEAWRLASGPKLTPESRPTSVPAQTGTPAPNGP